MFDVDAAIEARLSERSKDEKERWAKYQEDQRAKLPRMDGNAVLGSRMIEAALTELESATNRPAIYNRMAEGYALMGDYAKAVELATDHKGLEYLEILEAHDAEDCACPETQKFGKFTVPTRTPILRFANRTLTRCSICSHLRC